jgi:hypothetical protein
MAELVATLADRLCGNYEHVCVALIRQLAAGQHRNGAVSG